MPPIPVNERLRTAWAEQQAAMRHPGLHNPSIFIPSNSPPLGPSPVSMIETPLLPQCSEEQSLSVTPQEPNLINEIAALSTQVHALEEEQRQRVLQAALNYSASGSHSMEQPEASRKEKREKQEEEAASMDITPPNLNPNLNPNPNWKQEEEAAGERETDITRQTNSITTDSYRIGGIAALMQAMSKELVPTSNETIIKSKSEATAAPSICVGASEEDDTSICVGASEEDVTKDAMIEAFGRAMLRIEFLMKENQQLQEDMKAQQEKSWTNEYALLTKVEELHTRISILEGTYSPIVTDAAASVSGVQLGNGSDATMLRVAPSLT